MVVKSNVMYFISTLVSGYSVVYAAGLQKLRLPLFFSDNYFDVGMTFSHQFHFHFELRCFHSLGVHYLYFAIRVNEQVISHPPDAAR